MFFLPDTYNLSLYKFMYPYFIIGYQFKAKNIGQKLKELYSNT